MSSGGKGNLRRRRPMTVMKAMCGNEEDQMRRRVISITWVCVVCLSMREWGNLYHCSMLVVVPVVHFMNVFPRF